MTLKDAMYERHTVRKYKDKPLPEDIIEAIRLKSEEGFIDPLLELVADRSVAYPYAIPPAFPPEDTIIAVASYMMDGRFL